MARRLRVEYEGAVYHVINRGNYRRDVFETAATAKAFEAMLAEACEHNRWKLHAYVVMRNHYHLALQTPAANLVDGMHWLQSTFAARFNRFRSERGHLFQGRYQALVIEDAAALGRVVNYIHLNPVRAGIVPAEQVAAFRWSSLGRFVRDSRSTWLHHEPWLEQLGFTTQGHGWRDYVNSLVQLATDFDEQKRQGFGEMSRGWAIGTSGWRKALAKDHSHLALFTGVTADEVRELREVRWSSHLRDVLREGGHAKDDIATSPKGADWKVHAARRMRRDVGASCAWIANALNMGAPSSVRVYLCSRGI